MDATSDYLAWLEDPRVNSFLELRFARQSVAGIRHFIESCNESSTDLFLGAFVESGRHVGNVRLGPINVHHLSAPIGFLIGDPGYWGRGLASEMIHAVVAHGFQQLGLMKIWAGCYASNVGSLKAMIKSGLREEGVQRSQCADGTGRVDLLLLGATREEWLREAPGDRRTNQDV